MGDARIGSTAKEGQAASGGEPIGGVRNRSNTLGGGRTVRRAETNQPPETNNTRRPHFIPPAPGTRLQRVASGAKQAHDVEEAVERGKRPGQEHKSPVRETAAQAAGEEETQRMAREVLALRGSCNTDRDLCNLYARQGKGFSERFFDSLAGYLSELGNPDSETTDLILKRIFFGDAHQPTAEVDKVRRFNNYMLFCLIKIATFDELLSTRDIDKAGAALKSMIMCVLTNTEIDEYIEYKCENSGTESQRGSYLEWKADNRCDESEKGQWDRACKFLDDLVYCKRAVLRGADSSLSDQVLSLLLLLGFLKKKD